MEINGLGMDGSCPCGSGKEFKNCCLPKTLGLSTPSLPNTDLKLLKKKFKRFSLPELIGTLGGLQLFPENQSHTVRLEIASRVACNLEKSGNNSPTPKKLKKILNSCLPTMGEIGLMEDPPEGLFTENILFHGGNYVVYSGNTIEENYVLSVLLEVISKNADAFPPYFVEKIESSSLALLKISDEIATIMGHTRNMEPLETWRKDIFLPSGKQIKEVQKAVTFTKKGIDELFVEYGFDSNILDPFVLPVNDIAFSDEDYGHNPFYLKPFVKIDNEIIVSSPSSIISALHNFIILFSKKQDVYSVLFEKYIETLWEHVQYYFTLLQILPLNLDLPSLEENVRIKEAIFLIDFDKVAYVQLIVANPEIASELKLEDWKATEKLRNKVAIRDREITKWIFDTCNLSEEKVLRIKVLNSIEGEIALVFEKNDKQLTMGVEDLKTISNLDGSNGLTLWKFAKAAKEVDFHPFSSFIDNFYAYYKNNYSFHFPKYKKDGIDKPIISLTPGFGIDLKSRIYRELDNHGAPFGNPSYYTNVLRRHKNEEIPIYVADNSFGGQLYQLIEEYDQPIWVYPSSKYGNTTTNSELLFNFIDTIAYWIWQLTPSFKNHLTPLGNRPISIQIFVEESSEWYSHGDLEGGTDASELAFQWDVDNRTVHFFVPISINAFLMKPNNLGERLLLDSMLCAFGKLLEINGLQNTLGKLERQSILDKHAPLGTKKKILTVNSGQNASLDGRFVPNIRTIQDHDISEQMDWLVDILSDKLKGKTIIKNKDECTDICNLIVSEYSKKLKTKISLFNWKDLLQNLILLNEAICHHRASASLITTTVVECFYDIESLVELEFKNVHDVDKTALPLRTLIEIVAAEPPAGNREISICEMDELLAISFELVTWATISDLIRRDVVEYTLHVFGSGRISAINSDHEDPFSSFRKSKLLENYEHEISNFTNYFDSETPEFSDRFTESEIAFKAEFGLSFSEIVKLAAFLTDLGLEQQSSAPMLHLSELKVRIRNGLDWDEELTEKAIDLFSLRRRRIWEEPPSGFSTNDIWPWKYNRRLSYIRRPIIIGPDPKDDPLVFWGVRHVEESCRYLTDLVFSGRYNTDHKGCSAEIKKYIGSIINETGKGFTLAVKKWFLENTNLIVDSEVPIGPKQFFNSNVDLGDIDVLVIDKEKSRVYLIECKCINFGRNAQEMANEMDRFIGRSRSKNKNNWTKKHLKRESWIKANINSLIKKYELENEDLRVISLFIASSDIPIRHLHDIPMPFVSYRQLVREGISVFDRIN